MINIQIDRERNNIGFVVNITKYEFNGIYQLPNEKKIVIKCINRDSLFKCLQQIILQIPEYNGLPSTLSS